MAVQKADYIWRDFNTDGVPSSGAAKPKKREIRERGTWVESIIAAFITNGGYVFATKAIIDVVSSPPQYAMGWVVADPVASNNGIYQKTSIGAAWTRIADLPYSVIYAQNAGAGSANTIVATASVPVSASAYSQLISVPFTSSNTGAMTLAINGETPRPLVTNTGAAITAGYVQPGMSALVQIDGAGNYRLFSYGDASAIQTAVEAILVQVEAARDAAQAAASSVVPNVFPTKSALEAYAPTAAPAALRTAFLDTSYVDGSGSEYLDAGTTDPSLPGQATVVAGGVTHFYTRSNKVLRPQQHGCKTGGDPAINRGALIEMFNLANYTGHEIDMGDAQDVYEISDGITQVWSKKPIIRGTGATIKLNRGGAANVTYAMRFIATNLGVDLEGFGVDAAFQAANAFWIENQAATQVDANIHDASLVGVGGSNGYRKTTSDFGGQGLSVTGWFRHLLLEDCFCDEMKMAAAAVNVGVAGIGGIYIGRDANFAFAQYVDVINARIGKSWCEDPAQTSDMDGLMIFQAIPTGHAGRAPWSTRVRGGLFTDHWEYGIKIQAQNVDIYGPAFRINSAPTGGRTQTCVDLQYGEGSVRGATLFCTGSNAPNYAVQGTARSYAAGLMDIDNFQISGTSGAPTMSAIAYRWADESQLIGAMTVRNCSCFYVTPDYIASFRSRVNTEIVRVTGNSVRSIATAGVKMQGDASNAITTEFKGNANLGGSSVPMTSVVDATATVIGSAGDNTYFS